MGFVLPAPGGRQNPWNPEAFYATGRRSIQTILTYLEEHHHVPDRSVALDFGCGPGRLTQALAEHFKQVYGVDVAPSMLAAARAHNQYGNRCRYLLNLTDDLRQFHDSSVDFVVSDIVLQHLRPSEALRYVGEMIRVLRKGGVAVFFLPGRRIRRGWAPFVIASYNCIRYGTYATLNYGVEPSAVVNAITASGGRLLERNRTLKLDRGEQSPGPRPSVFERVWSGVMLALTDQFEGWIYMAEREG
jgi:SAM-dependent methyltransferase